MSTRINTSALPNLTGAAAAVISAVKGTVAAAPPPPVTMTLHGRQPPVGDHFRPDQPLFPSKLAIGDNRFLHYHVIVWTKLFGQETTDYGCVFSTGDGLRLCFNSEASLEKFEHWWERYSTIFFQDNEISEVYCPHPSSGRMDGYFVEDAPNYGSIGGGGGFYATGGSNGPYVIGGAGISGAAGPIGPVGIKGVSGNPGPVGQPTYVHAKSHETISEIFLPDWVMIQRHATARVLRMSNGWFFTEAKDGIMFKMQQS